MSRPLFVIWSFIDNIEAPKVNIIGLENIKKRSMYIPSHLHHMLFELLKNSMRAIVERFGADFDCFPPIKIVVAEGDEDITIKISDEGGGIRRSGLPLIWTYMYTTAQKPSFEESERAPLAGYFLFLK